MSDFHQWEIVVNLALQGLGAWLAPVMLFFSFLGTEEWYLLVFPAIFWCMDPVLGLRMGLMLMLSVNFNTVFKILLHNPRPFWIDPSVKAYAVETSFGLPSGHAQNAASVWGLLALAVRQSWFQAACAALILLIGVSRLFLGVHFLSDVVLGWVLGGLLLVVFVRLEPAIVGWIKRQPDRRLAAVIVGVSLAMVVLVAAAGLSQRAWQMPEAWRVNALAVAPEETPDPFSIHTAFTTGGLTAGFLLGALWMERRHGGYTAGGTPANKILRYMLGLGVLLLLWFGLGKLFPRGEDLMSYGLRYARYALIGLWVSGLAPLAFRKLRLDQ